MFSLSPRWKEEMVVSGPEGSFILAFWMGIPTVCLPPEECWCKVAPAWATDHWHELKSDLEDWCRSNGVRLEIDPKATVR